MTERQKIIKIIEKWAERTITTRVWGAGVQDPYNAAELADALLEAGIGDVQSLVDGNCVLCVKDKGCMRLYPEGDIKELEHRAEVAERALLTACVNLIKDEDNVNMDLLAHVVYTKFLRKAEKELSEEKGE